MTASRATDPASATTAPASAGALRPNASDSRPPIGETIATSTDIAPNSNPESCVLFPCTSRTKNGIISSVVYIVRFVSSTHAVAAAKDRFRNSVHSAAGERVTRCLAMNAIATPATATQRIAVIAGSIPSRSVDSCSVRTASNATNRPMPSQSIGVRTSARSDGSSSRCRSTSAASTIGILSGNTSRHDPR